MNTTTETLIKINLTRREAAKALCISEATLDRKVKDGTIPHVKIGNRVLFPATMLEQWANTEATKVARTE